MYYKFALKDTMAYTILFVFNPFDIHVQIYGYDYACQSIKILTVKR